MSDDYIDEGSPPAKEEERPRRRKRRRPAPAPAWPWFFGGTMLGIFIGAVLVLGTLFAAGGTVSGVTTGGGNPTVVGGPPQPQPTAVTVVDPGKLSNLTVRAANVEGPDNARVTIYEFSDFQ
jgi:hypothetical protein